MRNERVVRVRRVARPACVGIVLSLATVGASAHDFWIVPTAFDFAVGDTLELRGQTGISFPQSVSAVAVDRIAEARLLGAGSDERLTSFSTAGKSLLIRHRPSVAGQRIVAVALVPRVSPQSAAGFERYLRLEGAEAVADHYKREGRLPKDSVRMRVTKTAKTVVEVGRGGPRAYTRAVGHPLEIVPTVDLFGTRSGTSVTLRVLARGRPLPNATIVGGFAPFGSPWEAPAMASAAADGDSHGVRITTNAMGIATLPLGNDGLWHARVSHAVPAAPASGADWDVYFATLVFAVGTPPRPGTVAAARPAAPGDSAEVARIIAAFHEALAAGDSLRALSYLTPDVTILESGGEERLAEYRSHHLAADIEFAKAVRSASSPVRVTVRGDAAWASSTSTTAGNFRGREINSVGAELMVLARTPNGWRIAAIHWSSRARR